MTCNWDRNFSLDRLMKKLTTTTMVILLLAMFFFVPFVMVNNSFRALAQSYVHVSPVSIAVGIEQLPYTTLVAIDARFDEVNVAQDIANVWTDGVDYHIDVEYRRIGDYLPGNITLILWTTIARPQISHHTLYVSEAVLGETLAIKPFETLPIYDLFTKDGIIASLRTHIGKVEIEMVEMEMIGPELYDYARLILNSTTIPELPLTIDTSFNNTSPDMLSQFSFNLSAPAGFIVTPYNASVDLPPRSVANFLFGINTSDVEVGKYNLTYLLGYRNETSGLSQSTSGAIPMIVGSFTYELLPNNVTIVHGKIPKRLGQGTLNYTSTFWNLTQVTTPEGKIFNFWQNSNSSIELDTVIVNGEDAGWASVGGGIVGLAAGIGITYLSGGTGTAYWWGGGGGAAIGALDQNLGISAKIGKFIGSIFTSGSSNGVELVKPYDTGPGRYGIEFGAHKFDGCQRIYYSPPNECESFKGTGDPATRNLTGTNVKYVAAVGGIVIPIDKLALLRARARALLTLF